MIVKKKCPYTDRGGHFIEDVDTTVDSFVCKYCHQEVSVTHCLTVPTRGKRKAHKKIIEMSAAGHSIKDIYSEVEGSRGDLTEVRIPPL